MSQVFFLGPVVLTYVVSIGTKVSGSTQEVPIQNI